ncbi:hypothetical protein Tco_1291316, partial [Tanacetum coccineum]
DETDEEEKNDEFVRTSSNNSDDEDEAKIADKAEGDEDEEIDFTTSQLYDDMDIRLNEPVDTDKGFIQKEVFQFNNRVTALEKEVAKLKKDDPLKTQVTALVDEHLDARLGATRDEFMNFLSASITARITEQVKNHLLQIRHRNGLLKSYDLDKTLFSTYDKVYSLTRSRKDKDKDEDPSAGSDRGLKKRKTSKDAESTTVRGTRVLGCRFGYAIRSRGEPGKDDEEPEEKTPQQGPIQSWLMTLASSADKPSNTFDELMSTPIYFSAYIMNGLKITNLTQEILLGPAFRLLKGTRSNYAELEYDFEECYKALSDVTTGNFQTFK